mmetsp:Transcript_68078/g.142181  ORF Transcript_68078/g.142181 Transcript_68078/m.142181 type:complete len:226 (+) Transcript_68078:739-1416(+)
MSSGNDPKVRALSGQSGKDFSTQRSIAASTEAPRASLEASKCPSSWSWSVFAASIQARKTPSQMLCSTNLTGSIGFSTGAGWVIRCGPASCLLWAGGFREDQISFPPAVLKATWQVTTGKVLELGSSHSRLIQVANNGAFSFPCNFLTLPSWEIGTLSSRRSPCKKPLSFSACCFSALLASRHWATTSCNRCLASLLFGSSLRQALRSCCASVNFPWPSRAIARR